jgi:hypothetical protein
MVVSGHESVRGRPAVQAVWRWLGGICQVGSLRVRRLVARSSLRRAASRPASAPNLPGDGVIGLGPPGPLSTRRAQESVVSALILPRPVYTDNAEPSGRGRARSPRPTDRSEGQPPPSPILSASVGYTELSWRRSVRRSRGRDRKAKDAR